MMQRKRAAIPSAVGEDGSPPGALGALHAHASADFRFGGARRVWRECGRAGRAAAPAGRVESAKPGGAANLPGAAPKEKRSRMGSVSALRRKSRQAEKLDPQPQVVVAFGFLITNCAPSSPSV